MYAAADKKPEEAALPVETTVAVTEATEETLPTEAETLPVEVPAEVKNIHSTVPRYYQTDYPYIKFGKGEWGTLGRFNFYLAR